MGHAGGSKSNRLLISKFKNAVFLLESPNLMPDKFSHCTVYIRSSMYYTVYSGYGILSIITAEQITNCSCLIPIIYIIVATLSTA